MPCNDDTPKTIWPDVTLPDGTMIDHKTSQQDYPLIRGTRADTIIIDDLLEVDYSGGDVRILNWTLGDVADYWPSYLRESEPIQDAWPSDMVGKGRPPNVSTKQRGQRNFKRSQRRGR